MYNEYTIMVSHPAIPIVAGTTVLYPVNRMTMAIVESAPKKPATYLNGVWMILYEVISMATIVIKEITEPTV